MNSQRIKIFNAVNTNTNYRGHSIKLVFIYDTKF